MTSPSGTAGGGGCARTDAQRKAALQKMEEREMEKLLQPTCPEDTIGSRVGDIMLYLYDDKRGEIHRYSQLSIN